MNRPGLPGAVHGELPLEIKMVGVKLGNVPLTVPQVDKAGSEVNIKFVTLPGHVDGRATPFTSVSSNRVEKST